MSNKRTAGTVVIGGGAVGTSVACYLAMSGMDVTLVERGEFAWGTSRRCEGHVVTYDTPPGDFSLFCKTGQDLFYEAQKFLPVDFDFSPEGIGLLVDNESHLEMVKANYEGKQKEGYNVTLWDRDELRRHEPNIGDNVIGCLNFNNDCTLNPMRLCFGLAEHARAHGAVIMPRTHVMDLRMANGRVSGVETDKGLILTENVVLAAGVWTPRLGAMLGVNVPIRPRQGHILVTERVQGLLNKAYVEYGYLLTKHGLKRDNVTPDMDKFGVAFVIEPSTAGTVLIGSSRRFVGMDTRPHPSVMRAVAERGTQFFPALSDMRLLRCYAGVRPATTDELPIISTTHIPGLFIGAGHEGLGISLSLITGKIMSQLVGGQTPFIDISYMGIDRFGLNPPAMPVGQTAV
ncbi:MAG: FAD-binding oxidoreductase [Desulfovibrio sp.]|uniref:NAD(P)/FAD-dependent oxidoreductase n=1 Tax=Desulfovibrio TaxID=872 RepID=UPI00259128CF|nr:MULTISPECIES: FAD-dependent oxidoreductase [Desulfovibrio]MCD7982769.1 FAD-binding oxidoreductase [Desulfovibrio sp.]MDY3810687.1 FAD-dependent oxidoreductase [Desulfovibrio porci]